MAKNDGGKAKRASASEAIDSLIRYSNNIGDLKIIQEKIIKAAGRSTVQPHIIAFGPHVSTPTSFVICIDQHSFKVSTALQAIDVCYKLFHVLDTYYPPVSSRIWHLIQWGLYGMVNPKDKAFPWMRKTLKYLKDAGL